MKKYVPFKLFLSIVCLSAGMINVACQEEGSTDPLPIDRLVIGGEEEPSAGDTITYNASLYEGESYTWTVPAGAEIVGGAGTFAIDVAFSAAGSGDITVAARGATGTLTVAVEDPALPEAAVALPNDTVLVAGATGPVRISFEQPIETAPVVGVVPAAGTAGGAVSAVTRVNDRTFEVIYTAGTGDGTDKISVDKAVTTAYYGAAAMDTVVTFNAYPTDNTSATGELFASRTPVDSTTTSTLSVVFSEPLLTSDTVKVSVVGAAQTYVTDANMMTMDGETWTYDFQPEGGATELATVSVSNLPADLAGNPTVA
ncbi:MAG: hypothetical protein WA960_23160, partial [Tunicatimonas sp.]